MYKKSFTFKYRYTLKYTRGDRLKLTLSREPIISRIPDRITESCFDQFQKAVSSDGSFPLIIEKHKMMKNIVENESGKK